MSVVALNGKSYFESRCSVSWPLNGILILHENRAYSKRSSNRRNLKTLALHLSVDGNILETKLFENDYIMIIVFSLA